MSHPRPLCEARHREFLVEVIDNPGWHVLEPTVLCGLGQEMGRELRLSARTHHEQHQELGRLEGCGMTEILAYKR